VAGSCEVGNEASGYIKGWEFLCQWSDIHLVNSDSAPWR